jgi:hypothetical protein
MEEDTLFVAEMPTAADGNGRRRDEEGELDDRANVDGSATGDKTRSGPQILRAASHQISMMTTALLIAHRQRSKKGAERSTQSVGRLQ